MSSLSNDDAIVALNARVAENQGATDDSSATTVAAALDDLITKLIAAGLMLAAE